MPSRPRLITLQPPLGGLNRKQGFQNQLPFTTPDCRNVRPFDTFDQRRRIGSRPGLAKSHNQLLGSGNPVRMLENVTVARNDRFTFWEDLFELDRITGVWHEATWLTDGPEILPDNLDQLVYDDDVEVGMYRDELPDIAGGSPYTIGIYIEPWFGENIDGTPKTEFHGEFYIYARMNNTTPVVTTDGIKATLTLTSSGDSSVAGDGEFDGNLKTYKNSTLQNTYAFTSGDVGNAQGGWFTVTINGEEITCAWQGNVLLNAQDITGDLDGDADHRLGLGFKATAKASNTNAAGLCIVNHIKVNYFKESGETPYRTMLIASSNGTIYKEDDDGDMVLVSSNLSINNDRPIQAAEFQQKLYLADWGENKTSGTDGTLAGTDLTAAGISDWTTLSISIYDDVVEISNGQGTVTDGVYAISSVVAGKLVLTENAGTGTCTYRICRGPKIYDPVANTISLWIPTTGNIPIGCKLITVYRGRLMLAADQENPQNYYASRQDDPLDFDYSGDDTDAQRAFAGNLANSGKIGKPLVAWQPHADDFLILGTTSTLHVMRGDPTYEGQIDLVSGVNGIVSPSAITKGKDGETYFLSYDGLYVVYPGTSFTPQTLSYDKIPVELQNLDTVKNYIALQYNVKRYGVHIIITPLEQTAANNHFWYDLQTNSFWIDRYQNRMEPFSILYNAPEAASGRTVIYGGRDGYLRTFYDQNQTDESDDIDSYVYIGPIRLGNNEYFQGIIQEMQAILSEKSRNVTWQLTVGDSHELTLFKSNLAAQIDYTGVWKAGANPMDHPRLGGEALFLKIVGTRQWALELVNIKIQLTGKSRVNE